jgi:hypothetical protein
MPRYFFIPRRRKNKNQMNRRAGERLQKRNLQWEQRFNTLPAKEAVSERIVTHCRARLL